MSTTTLPRDAVPLEEAIALFPTLRQSLLARFDDCALSALLDIRYAHGWNTQPQARGSMFHRFAAEMLRTMREHGEGSIPVSEALEILYEVLRQEGVALEDRLRVPLRDIAKLRMAAIKFAHDNSFSIDRVLDIEKRLQAPVTYKTLEGPVTRILTGQLDVLLAGPPDGDGVVRSALVIDWKDTWALPPEEVEESEHDDGAHISYEGYFQQRFYGFLVMANFPAIQRVTLREFYPRKTKVREATVTVHDMEHIEREMALLAENFDATVAVGTRHAGTLHELDAWRPSPGKHCSFCVRPGVCPIEDDARLEGAIRNEKQARAYAASFEWLTRMRADRQKQLKTWTLAHGAVDLKGGKGRRWVGHKERQERYTNKTTGEVGTRVKSIFGLWTSPNSDRGEHPDDEKLIQAMRDSVAETQEMRKAAAR
ncbi:MAG: PD-(D/E)XK nuclease family protein [Chloroflexi bacterium]|nr:PD-(D/E)XK nuclease family protein [Chloroflexota bacterium]